MLCASLRWMVLAVFFAPLSLHAVALNADVEQLESAVLDVERDYFEAVELSDSARVDLLTATLDAAAQPKPPPEIKSLLSALRRHESPLNVARAAQQARDALEHVRPLPVPAQVPDLARGRTLYAQDCATCHGARGEPPARAGTSAPPSFREDEVMNELSPSEAYLLLEYGVPGTAMPSFELLSPADRWNVSFYLFTLRPLRCTGAAPKLGLPERSRARDGELAARYGDAALACLRQ